MTVVTGKELLCSAYRTEISRYAADSVGKNSGFLSVICLLPTSAASNRSQSYWRLLIWFQSSMTTIHLHWWWNPLLKIGERETQGCVGPVYKYPRCRWTNLNDWTILCDL